MTEPRPRDLPRTFLTRGIPFFVVHFVNDEAVWERFDGQVLHPSEPPRLSRSLPVLVLLPDRLFFFVQPEITHHAGTLRQRIAAARLQLEQMFPGWEGFDAPPSDQPGNEPFNPPAIVFDAQREHLLGCFHHPKLAGFIRRHQNVLRRANAVTTPFFLAWNIGFQENVQNWIWSSPEGGITAIMHSGQMTYFPGNTMERSVRLGSAAPATDSGTVPSGWKRWQMTELLQFAPRVGWSRLRLPLPAAPGESHDPRRLARLWVTMMLIGSLFCIGQVLRLSTHQEQLQRLEQATKQLYSEVLALPLGNDPFGRLLFRREQLQNPVRSGPDALTMLGLLSTSAPPDLLVESFSLGPNSGIIQARMETFEQLETLLQSLDGQSRLRFNLDQASSADEELRVTLRVSY